jgi:hypothetical protein
MNPDTGETDTLDTDGSCDDLAAIDEALGEYGMEGE